MPPKKTKTSKDKKTASKKEEKEEDIELSDDELNEDVLPEELDDEDWDENSEENDEDEQEDEDQGEESDEDDSDEDEKPSREEKLESFDEFMGSKKISSLELEDEKPKQRKRGTQDVPLKLYRRIALGFIVVCGGLLLFMLVFSATSATISITPKKEQISVSLLRTVGGTTDRIEGAVFAEQVQYSETFSVEEGREVEGFASGKMKVINNSDSPVSLIPRTRFQSESGVIFRVAERVQVSAKGTATANVTADVKGKVGEVPQGKFTIPGLPVDQQQEVYGESVADMTGGVRVAGILTEADVAQAEDAIRENLKKQKLDQYRTAEGAQTFSDNIASIDVSEQTVSAKVGDEVDAFTITLKAQVTAIFFEGDALDTLTRQAVFAKVPEDKRLHTVGDPRFEVENVDTQAKTATLKLIRGGEVTLDPSAKIIASAQFTNKTKEEVEAYINTLNIAESYDVRIRPKWRSRTPSAPDRIKVEVK